MKRIILMLLLTSWLPLLFAQEALLSKKITISFNDIELQETFKILEKQTGILIAYNNKLPGMKDKVNVTFKDVSIEYILNTLLNDKSLGFKIIGDQVTIFQKKTKTSVQRGNKNSTIEGTVIAESINLPLPFINIVIEVTGKGTVTDKNGVFTIENLMPGKYNILVSSIGYEQTSIKNLEVHENNTLNIGTIKLKETTITLNEVTVSPGSFSVMGTAPLSRQTLMEKDIKNMSFSEDITRVVSRLPGVSSNDFSSKFTVRGGETDEVLITLDGMELYDPFHQRDFAGGLFSIVDIETIKGVDLLTGGFSAEYGNRQSAVFNMKSKNVTEKRYSSIGLSIMNARVYTEGIYASGKGSYLVSARRGMLDQAFKLIGQTENMPIFYDLHGRFDYKLTNKHTLSFHVLHAGDKTEIRDIVQTEPDWDIHDTEYNNTYVWLTLKSAYNKKLYSRTLLFNGYITQDRRGNAYKVGYSDKVKFLLTDERELYFYGLKQDWNWSINEKIYLKGGYDLRQLNSGYNYSLSLTDVRVDSTGLVGDYSEERKIIKNPSGQQLGAYISGKFNVLPNLFFESGLRYDVASYTNEKFISPRLGIAYALTKSTFLRGAWGHYYQSQLIYNMAVNYNMERFQKAEMAEHYVLGLEHQFSNGINIRFEGYYKDISLPSVNYQNLRDQWEVFPEARNDVVKLNISGVKAKGIELFLKYDVGKKISWWFSYALSKAEENIQSIEFNGLLDQQTGWLPRVNNQYHTIYCDINYRMNNTWHFNLSWQYYTGWPLTIYEYNFVETANDSLHFYPNHTRFRGEKYPDYHRMDLRINRYFLLKSSKISAYVHIINLYNRENLRKFDLDVRNDQEQLVPDGQGGYQYFRDDKNWFGITPVIGISWEF